MAKGIVAPLIYDLALCSKFIRNLFRVKLVRPVPADRNKRDVCKEGTNMETGSGTMPLRTTVFLSMSAVLRYLDC